MKVKDKGPKLQEEGPLWNLQDLQEMKLWEKCSVENLEGDRKPN